MNEFRLTIPGPPQGQGRPLIGRTKAGRPVAFTGQKTRTYAQLVQGEWIAAGRPTLPDGPYALTVMAYWRRPASHLRKNGQLSAVGLRSLFPGKPDLDNVVKGILDALCAVGAVPDDRHLFDVLAHKSWGPEACVEVSVAAWERPPVDGWRLPEVGEAAA